MAANPKREILRWPPKAGELFIMPKGVPRGGIPSILQVGIQSIFQGGAARKDLLPPSKCPVFFQERCSRLLPRRVLDLYPRSVLDSDSKRDQERVLDPRRGLFRSSLFLFIGFLIRFLIQEIKKRVS